MTELLKETLQNHFGFSSFKPLQEDIIQCVLSSKDCIVIMPTGGGKSLCYQIPALISDGIALVISPLIALMRDQVMALKANGIPAATINSSITPNEMKVVYDDIEQGKLRLLYVSPEKVMSSTFLRYIQTKKLSLIAIDEAHCVSIWGNDFRPDYAGLHRIVRQFPDTPVLALTATADKATQKDIADQLGLRDPRRFLASFERKNIHIAAMPGYRRMEQIIEFLEQHRGEPGILYCLSRRSTEYMAAKLRSKGFKARFYHAMLDAESRKEVQDAFQRDEIQIVCATIAFGMGIDKANIRWIIHNNMPKNIESYYQEIGRSGRDGAPARALMFYSMRDVIIYRKFIEESEADATFKEVQRKKLERMLEFARASSCRTNVILNYFGEYRTTSCGHCDNCKQPPEGFDGTEIAKLAIEACSEARGRAGINLLIDLIRGSERKELLQRKLHLAGSYGKGKDICKEEWLIHMNQIVNLGLLEIDYTDHANLKSTPLSELVRNDLEKVTLFKPILMPQDTMQPRKTKTESFEEALLDRLRETRSRLAKIYEIPAYLVFSDQSLKEIAMHKPLSEEELLGIRGIGQFKTEQYGPEIIQTIRDFVTTQDFLPGIKGRSKLETLALYKMGLSLEEIAKQRAVSYKTVIAHLINLYEEGEDIDLRHFLKGADLVRIRQLWQEAGMSNTLKPVYEALDGKIEYETLRIALAVFRREEGQAK